MKDLVPRISIGEYTLFHFPPLHNYTKGKVWGQVMGWDFENMIGNIRRSLR